MGVSGQVLHAELLVENHMQGDVPNGLKKKQLEGLLVERRARFPLS